MKLLRVTSHSVKVLCLALALNACAGSEEDAEEFVEENGEENAANVEDGNEMSEEDNEYAENNGNENMNAENGNNMGNGNNFMNEEVENASVNADVSANEFVNNAAGDNFLNMGNSNFAAENPVADPTADAGFAENSTDDLGVEPSDATLTGNVTNTATGNEVPMNAAPNSNVGATDASLAVPEASPAPTGGRVHYVTKGGATAHDSPSGQVVRNLEQGDHPLVTAEGEWSRTSDGAYIQNSSLTTKPVSRAKSPKAWR